MPAAALIRRAAKYAFAPRRRSRARLHGQRIKYLAIFDTLPSMSSTHILLSHPISAITPFPQVVRSLAFVSGACTAHKGERDKHLVSTLITESWLNLRPLLGLWLVSSSFNSYILVSNTLCSVHRLQKLLTGCFFFLLFNYSFFIISSCFTSISSKT